MLAVDQDVFVIAEQMTEVLVSLTSQGPLQFEAQQRRARSGGDGDSGERVGIDVDIQMSAVVVKRVGERASEQVAISSRYRRPAGP